MSTDDLKELPIRIVDKSENQALYNNKTIIWYYDIKKIGLLFFLDGLGDAINSAIYL